MSVSIRRFAPVEPLDLLRGPLGEWIVLILLCGLFIALAYAILPKSLTEGRKGKAVAVFVGLILGIGLFLTKRLFSFNFESFGFLAAMLIIILMFLVAYGLLKMQLRKDMAVSITYCMIFLTFYIMSPSLFDTFARTLPILNGIFFLAFFYMFGKLIYSMIKGSGLAIPEKIKDVFVKPEADEVPEKTDQGQTTKPTLGGISKMNEATYESMSKLKTDIDGVIRYLESLNGWMDEHQSKQAMKALNLISKSKGVVRKGFEIMTKDLLQRTEHPKYKELVQQANQLKTALHDFYLNLEKGMEQIKVCHIRIGMPHLQAAQKNFEKAVDAILKIRETDKINPWQ